MADLEQQLSAVMNNPEMMEKIMALAQSMQNSPPTDKKAPEKEPSQSFPDIDLSMIQKLSGFAQKSGIDNNQRALLQALRPYLSGNRISRLERAMRAAKMAGFATSLLGR
ncbi:MAG: hypothetical protein ACI3ZR_08615 [bacterium]